MLIAQQAGGGFEKTSASNRAAFFLGRLIFQIVQIRMTQSTANGLKMKLNIVGQVGGQSSQQVASKLRSRGAA